MTDDALAKRAVHRIVRMADRKGGVTLERGVRGRSSACSALAMASHWLRRERIRTGGFAGPGLAAALPSASAVL